MPQAAQEHISLSRQLPEPGLRLSLPGAGAASSDRP